MRKLMHTLTHTPRPPQRGVSLVEALVGLLVLSLGLLGATRLQSTLQAHADLSRQRTEAVRLAQHEIEQLRSFASSTDYAGITSMNSTQQALQATPFTLDRAVDDGGTGTVKTAAVTARWADRSGAPQTVALATSLAGTAPAYSGVLGLPPQDKAVATPFGRPARVPLRATPLADGRSVLRPGSRSGLALVFNPVTGGLASLCTGLPTPSARTELLATDLQQCETVAGSVVTGHIRFSLGTQPQADRANDAALRMHLALVLDQAARTGCDSEAMKTVSFRREGPVGQPAQLHTVSVPADATPASLGVTTWAEHDERFVAYTCWVLMPTAGAGWSGHLAIAPDSGTYQVCRYSRDTDGSGAIDRNEEHPARYRDVRESLAQQNYLVTRADVACPAGLVAMAAPPAP